MKVRIATLGVPLFRLHDLEINEQWLEVEELAPKQRASFLTYAGKYVRVHPEDLEKLGALGLVAETAPAIDSNGKPTGKFAATGRVLEKKNSNPKNVPPTGNANGNAGAKKE